MEASRLPPQIEPLPPEAAPSPPAAASGATHSLVQSGEQCPSCGRHVAPGQRYCLHCGERCGDPRLPFMSAVTFMDAMKSPASAGASAPPPRRQQRRMSPNMALFATIGVLLLAMGVGVLIGRSGNHSAVPTAAAPQVIEVGGGSGESEVTPSQGGNSAAKAGATKKVSKKALKKQADSQEGADSYLHTAPGVKLPPAKAQLGESCEEGTAGCTNGKFEGNFFE